MGDNSTKLFKLSTLSAVGNEEVRAISDELGDVREELSEYEEWNKRVEAALAEVTEKVTELAQVSPVDGVLQEMRTSIGGAEENMGREISQLRARLDNQRVMFQSYNKAGNDACPGFICQQGRVHMTHHDAPLGTNGGPFGDWLFTDRVEIPVEGKYVFFLTAYALKDPSNSGHSAVLSLKTSKLSFPLLSDDSGMKTLPILIYLEKGESVYLENGSKENTNSWVANLEIPLTFFGFRISD